MFADDTTLYDADQDLNILINRFLAKIKPLLDWCFFNKLDLNWSKTYFMFVTNRRVKLPSEISVKHIINNKTVEVSVKVVKSFRLLGVTLDNKLIFSENCSNHKKVINRKLFSIKRLFYLATSVKIHFFKTFVLPYFDYCLSLIIYFPGSALQSLSNCFYCCLYRLFKFKPDEIIYRESSADEEEKVMNDFYNKLQSYNLFTFQTRVFSKLITFSHSIKTNPNSPIKLKKDLEVNVDESAGAATQPTASYNLRNGAKVKNSLTKTKFETLTFGYFFPRLLLAFQHIDFSLRKDSFQTHLNANINTNLKIFLDIFPKFDVKYCNFYKRKKKKEL